MSTAPPDGPRDSGSYGDGGHAPTQNFGAHPGYGAQNPYAAEPTQVQPVQNYAPPSQGDHRQHNAAAAGWDPAHESRTRESQAWGSGGWEPADGSPARETQGRQNPQASAAPRSARSGWPDALASSSVVVGFLALWSDLTGFVLAAGAITLGLLARERSAASGDRDGVRIALAAIVVGAAAALWWIFWTIVYWAKSAGV